MITLATLTIGLAVLSMQLLLEQFRVFTRRVAREVKSTLGNTDKIFSMKTAIATASFIENSCQTQNRQRYLIGLKTR